MSETFFSEMAKQDADINNNSIQNLFCWSFLTHSFLYVQKRSFLLEIVFQFIRFQVILKLDS